MFADFLHRVHFLLSLLQADKLKAALIQYKRNQPSHNSKQELRKSGASQRTPDIGKDVLSKKESLSTGKKAKQLSAKSALDNSQDMCVNKPSLSPSKSARRSSMKTPPDVSMDIMNKVSLSPRNSEMIICDSNSCQLPTPVIIGYQQIFFLIYSALPM